MSNWKEFLAVKNEVLNGVCAPSGKTDYNDEWPDVVNAPKHYTNNESGIQPIEIAEHMSFNLGNVIKYVMRAGLKDNKQIEDLEKAEYYIKREIERLIYKKK